ncbi:hypothetical protein HanIR_Chr08g0381161 [Helianthus annuus]|nr:hypothetical protein HanIR_Chr08g0381161 [Helianthus annuus]
MVIVDRLCDNILNRLCVKIVGRLYVSLDRLLGMSNKRFQLPIYTIGAISFVTVPDFRTEVLPDRKQIVLIVKSIEKEFKVIYKLFLRHLLVFRTCT